MSDLVSFWSSPNFFQPPYRSWPHPPTDLERMAARMGIDDEDLRELLREEIERRRELRVASDAATTHELSEEPTLPPS